MARKGEQRMTCLRCPRYDQEARHCREGKTNPSKKTDAVAVAEQLGLQSLCHYNPFRDALALRMYFPRLPAAIAASQKKRRSYAPAPPPPSDEKDRPDP